MNRLKAWLKKFFLYFSPLKTIGLLVLVYGAIAAIVLSIYFSLFQGGIPIGESPQNVFAVVIVVFGYIGAIIVPQLVGEVYRYRKLICILASEDFSVKKIIKNYSITFPRYNEFKIFDKSYPERNAIGFMILWICVAVFLFGFFVSLRISELDDFIALPSLAISAAMGCVALSIIIRLISKSLLRKAFWGKINTASLTKEDTDLMEVTEVAANKKTIFSFKVYIGAEMLIMLFVVLALYFVIDFLGLMIAVGCCIAAASTMLIISSIKKYRKDQEDTGITYKF